MDFLKGVQKCVDEYEVHYRPEMERMQKEQIDKEIERQKVRFVLSSFRSFTFFRNKWRNCDLIWMFRYLKRHKTHLRNKTLEKGHLYILALFIQPNPRQWNNHHEENDEV